MKKQWNKILNSETAQILLFKKFNTSWPLTIVYWAIIFGFGYFGYLAVTGNL